LLSWGTPTATYCRADLQDTLSSHVATVCDAFLLRVLPDPGVGVCPRRENSWSQPVSCASFCHASFRSRIIYSFERSLLNSPEFNQNTFFCYYGHFRSKYSSPHAALLFISVIFLKELHNLYSSLSIIRMIKSRRMRSAVHVARMGRRGMHVGYWWESQKK
jgi:hypothetical protein